MKTLYILVFLLFEGALLTQAQTIVTVNGSTSGTPTVYIGNGLDVYLKGGMNIVQGGSGAGSDYLQNNGVIHIVSDPAPGQSDFTNNVTGLQTYTTGQTTGEVIFAADNETQSITGSGSAPGEQLQHGLAQVRQQVGPAREQVAELAQVLGGLVGLGRACGAQPVDQRGPQPHRVLVGLAEAFEQFFHSISVFFVRLAAASGAAVARRSGSPRGGFVHCIMRDSARAASAGLKSPPRSDPRPACRARQDAAPRRR